MIKKIIISVILFLSIFLWQFNSEPTEITNIFAMFHGLIVGIILILMWNDYLHKLLHKLFG